LNNSKSATDQKKRFAWKEENTFFGCLGLLTPGRETKPSEILAGFYKGETETRQTELLIVL
jgi:hypothetical protein